jgi:hypothetical protein
LQLLERYEVRFGETPPVHFLTPKTSKSAVSSPKCNKSA